MKNHTFSDYLIGYGLVILLLLIPISLILFLLFPWLTGSHLWELSDWSDNWEEGRIHRQIHGERIVTSMHDIANNPIKKSNYLLASGCTEEILSGWKGSSIYYQKKSRQ